MIFLSSDIMLNLFPSKLAELAVESLLASSFFYTLNLHKTGYTGNKSAFKVFLRKGIFKHTSDGNLSTTNQLTAECTVQTKQLFPNLNNNITFVIRGIHKWKRPSINHQFYWILLQKRKPVLMKMLRHQAYYPT